MELDYISNCADPDNLSVPDGFDVEIFKYQALEKAFQMQIFHQRENMLLLGLEQSKSKMVSLYSST